MHCELVEISVNLINYVAWSVSTIARMLQLYKHSYTTALQDICRGDSLFAMRTQTQWNFILIKGSIAKERARVYTYIERVNIANNN